MASTVWHSEDLLSLPLQHFRMFAQSLSLVCQKERCEKKVLLDIKPEGFEWNSVELHFMEYHQPGYLPFRCNQCLYRGRSHNLMMKHLMQCHGTEEEDSYWRESDEKKDDELKEYVHEVEKNILRRFHFMTPALIRASTSNEGASTSHNGVQKGNERNGPVIIKREELDDYPDFDVTEPEDVLRQVEENVAQEVINQAMEAVRDDVAMVAVKEEFPPRRSQIDLDADTDDDGRIEEEEDGEAMDQSTIRRNQKRTKKEPTSSNQEEVQCNLCLQKNIIKKIKPGTFRHHCTQHAIEANEIKLFECTEKGCKFYPRNRTEAKKHSKAAHKKQNLGRELARQGNYATIVANYKNMCFPTQD